MNHHLAGELRSLGYLIDSSFHAKGFERDVAVFCNELMQMHVLGDTCANPLYPVVFRLPSTADFKAHGNNPDSLA